jgi:hypothetical protein
LVAQEDPELSFTFLSLISRINRAEAWISVRTHHGKLRLVVEASRPTTSTYENGHRLRLGHWKRDVSVAIDKQASKRIWNSEVSYLLAGFGFEFISLGNIRNYQNWFNVHWRYLWMDIFIDMSSGSNKIVLLLILILLLEMHPPVNLKSYFGGNRTTR